MHYDDSGYFSIAYYLHVRSSNCRSFRFLSLLVMSVQASNLVVKDNEGFNAEKLNYGCYMHLCFALIVLHVEDV